MKIACLGWGSLVWDPRSLHVRAGWFADGPLLPIEFTRESSDKRVTLVIVSADKTPAVRSLWALSSLDSLAEAKSDLAAREGIKLKTTPDGIGCWQRGLGSNPPEIERWATQLDLDAVIWTALPATFSSSDAVIEHVSKLSHEHRANAERYVRMAPRQIDTPYRRRLEQAFGWSPIGTL